MALDEYRVTLMAILLYDFRGPPPCLTVYEARFLSLLPVLTLPLPIHRKTETTLRYLPNELCFRVPG